MDGEFACTEVLKDLDEVRGKNSKVKNSHKEESSTRIANDLKDRTKLRDALQLCPHPFDPESNDQNLLINHASFVSESLNRAGFEIRIP